jgi:hypothetical protein
MAVCRASEGIGGGLDLEGRPLDEGDNLTLLCWLGEKTPTSWYVATS